MTDTLTCRSPIAPWVRRAAPLAVLGSLAACGTLDPGLYYAAPETTVSSSVSVPGTTLEQTAEAAAGRLIDAGFSLQTYDPAAGRIVLRSNSTALVDCGTYTQNLDGVSAVFPAGTENAAIFYFEVPGDVYLRMTAVSSRVEVRLTPGRADVREAHEVTLSHKPASGNRVFWSETKTVGTDPVTFRDGRTCVSAGRVQQALSG